MKRIKVLVLVLAFALAAMGGAYAMWFDTLTVAETAETGSLDLNWANLVVSDPSPNYAASGDVYTGALDSMDADNPNDKKNVGSMNAEISAVVNNTVPKGGDQDINSNMDKLTINLKNGYPGYQESIDVDIVNTGTVPAKFEVKKAGTIPAWLLVNVTNRETGEKLDLEGFQIEPGKSIPVRIVNRVIENLPGCSCYAVAPQNASAMFEVELKAVQWNEYKYKLLDEIQAARK